MNGIFFGKTLLFLLLVFVLPFMGNSQKFAGQKCMNDGAQEYKGGDQIKGLLLDAVYQDGKDIVNVAITVTLKAARKGLGVSGRFFSCRSSRPSN